MLNLTATELLHRQTTGDLTAEAITQSYLSYIKQHDAKINAFLAIDEAGALDQANAIDVKRKRGESLGKLAGIPIALKDILCVKGQRTTAGSKILQNYVPPYDAHVITKLQRRRHLDRQDEHGRAAMGSSTELAQITAT